MGKGKIPRGIWKSSEQREKKASRDLVRRRVLHCPGAVHTPHWGSKGVGKGGGEIARYPRRSTESNKIEQE